MAFIIKLKIKRFCFIKNYFSRKTQTTQLQNNNLIENNSQSKDFNDISNNTPMKINEHLNIGKSNYNYNYGYQLNNSMV